MRKYEIPKWARRGSLVWFGHYHEPPGFLKRKGDWHEHMRDAYKEAHSDRYIKKLAELGCNNINAHFYKGDGLAVEARHQKDLKKLVRTCHKYNIKVNAYAQFGSISQENLLSGLLLKETAGRFPQFPYVPTHQLLPPVQTITDLRVFS